MTAPRRKRTTSPMKPRRRAGQPQRKDDPESREQVKLIQWADWMRIPPAEDVEEGARISDYLIAIPNGGLRHYATAGKLKAEGAKPGVSDLQLPLARHGHIGLWIEMKAPERRPKTERSPTGESADQIAWGKRMTHAGHLYRVAYTMHEAAQLIAWYLGIPSTGLQGDRICPANPPS